ncbi:unnamed protein product [Ixodes pacificus]
MFIVILQQINIVFFLDVIQTLIVILKITRELSFLARIISLFVVISFRSCLFKNVNVESFF